MDRLIASRRVVQESIFGDHTTFSTLLVEVTRELSAYTPSIFSRIKVSAPKADAYGNHLANLLTGKHPQYEKDPVWLQDVADWSLDDWDIYGAVNAWFPDDAKSGAYATDAEAKKELNKSKIIELKKQVNLALVQNPNFPISDRLFDLVRKYPEAFIRGNPAAKLIVTAPHFWAGFSANMGAQLQELLSKAHLGGFFKEYVGPVQEVLTFKRALELARRSDWARSGGHPQWPSGTDIPVRVTIYRNGVVEAVYTFKSANIAEYYASFPAYARKIRTTEAWLRSEADPK